MSKNTVIPDKNGNQSPSCWNSLDIAAYRTSECQPPVNVCAGVDVHKIAGPMAMLGGGSNMMGWLPMLGQDPSLMSLMFSQMMGSSSGIGGPSTGASLFGGGGAQALFSNPMSLMAMGSAW